MVPLQGGIMAFVRLGGRRDYDGDWMRVARVGEGAMQRWLEQRPRVVKVDDLRDDVEWRHRDVDFRATFDDGSVRLIEVKTSSNIGKGEIVFEVTRNYDGNCFQGWSLKSAADWVVYYHPPTAEAYGCSLPGLREVFWGDVARWPTRTLRSDESKYTINRYLPLAECRHLFRVYHVEPLAEHRNDPRLAHVFARP